MNINTLRIDITLSSVLRFFGVLLAIGAIYFFREFVVILLVAVVLASSIEGPINYLGKHKISRVWAVSFIYLAIISFIIVSVAVILPSLASDVAKFISTIPNILDSIRIFGRDLGFRDLSMQIQELSRDISAGQILSVLQNTFTGSVNFFQTTGVLLGSIFNALLVFVLSFYLAIEERGVQKFLTLMLPRKYESYVEDIWKRAQSKIGLWMQGQLLLAVIVSLLVYIPLKILGVPYAGLLASLAFFGEFIPVVGLTIATVPALFVAYASGGLQLLGIVAVIYFIVSQLEGNVLYPKMMNKLIGVPSVIVMISLIVGMKLAGFWGVLLSVPVAAIVMELLSDIDKRK